MTLLEKSPGAKDAEALGIDQAGRSITFENSKPSQSLQVASLTRRCAISTAMAEIVAPLAYGERGR